MVELIICKSFWLDVDQETRVPDSDPDQKAPDPHTGYGTAYITVLYSILIDTELELKKRTDLSIGMGILVFT
jgi:hypothetical protein